MTDTLSGTHRVLTYYDASYPPEVLNPSPPAPLTLASLNPTSITAAAAPELVTLTGTGFTSASRVWADEEEQITTHVSSTELTYMAQGDDEGSQTITVRRGAEVSNSIELTVDPADPGEDSGDGGDVETPEVEPDPDPEPDEENGDTTL
jgi:IPT/TIG domain